MHSTTSAAHRRVGAAAVLAFLALVLLGLTRNHSAAAAPVTPAAAPTVQPGQPQSRPPFHRGGDDGRGFGGGAVPAPSTGGGTGNES